MVLEKRSPSPIIPTVQQSLLYAVLAEILRIWLHHDSTLVEEVRDYATAHIREPVTLDQLAAVSGMSKFHFARQYKALTGSTPMEDLRTLRLERAQDLVMTTDLPLKTIAEDVGFAGVYHLCRIFRQRFGISPGKLRRRHPEARPPTVSRRETAGKRGRSR
jgi:transcriptional regulator GlxA family with amidase domain